jgi:hypothetical protein
LFSLKERKKKNEIPSIREDFEFKSLGIDDCPLRRTGDRAESAASLLTV